jgi:hypothetical protein
MKNQELGHQTDTQVDETYYTGNEFASNEYSNLKSAGVRAKRFKYCGIFKDG